jgi:O-methyltransferase
VADRFGLEIRPSGFRADFDAETAAIIRRVQRYSMTSPERIAALIQSVRYVSRADIEGSIVECGVWRGGSMMAVALTLMGLGRQDVDLYLFDTYEGMPAPTEHDIDFRGQAAATLLNGKRTKTSEMWGYAPIDDVRHNLEQTGYDMSRVHFVKGDVEITVPQMAPDEISLLRLDTDWYTSTRHELLHLYPRLSPRGVLILDDYGHWQGARKAFDEYVEENEVHLLLTRIDATGRIAVKTE